MSYIVHLSRTLKGSFQLKRNVRNNLNCMKNIINYCKIYKAKLIHISSECLRKTSKNC